MGPAWEAARRRTTLRTTRVDRSVHQRGLYAERATAAAGTVEPRFERTLRASDGNAVHCESCVVGARFFPLRTSLLSRSIRRRNQPPSPETGIVDPGRFPDHRNAQTCAHAPPSWGRGRSPPGRAHREGHIGDRDRGSADRLPRARDPRALRRAVHGPADLRPYRASLPSAQSCLSIGASLAYRASVRSLVLSMAGPRSLFGAPQRARRSSDPDQR